MNEQQYRMLSMEIFREVVTLPPEGLTVETTMELVNAYADAMRCMHRRANEREQSLRKRLVDLGVPDSELVA